jgi:3-phenylpropionate/cinnamic acid dioxygenase small subunit
MNIFTYEKVSEFIYKEAQYLDDKNWTEWLDLYCDDCIFWAPSWINENTYTSHPEEELNLLYLKGKQHLLDRVYRIETGDSFASLPMDRTTHLITNIRIDTITPLQADVKSNWLVHSYGLRESQNRGGFYEFQLININDQIKISQKKIILIDDKLVGPIDIFHI